jgi:uncharacterized phiE125 gp8 family phage protein
MLTLKTAPVKAAVSDLEVLSHLRLDQFAFDTEPDLRGKIAAACSDIENTTGRQLITATWQLVLPVFPGGRVVELPRPPLISTGCVITYYDETNTLQTLAAAKYAVVAPAGERCLGGWVSLLPSEAAWPATYCDTDQAVIVEFLAGYGTDPSSVPGFLRSMALVRLGELYEQRQIGISGTIYNKVIDLQTALAGWRVW